jgi:hypothetical protein
LFWELIHISYCFSVAAAATENGVFTSPENAKSFDFS